MMTLVRTLVVASIGLVSACLVAAEIRIRDYPPDKSIDGQAVPSEATFNPALSSGESVVVSVEGRDALQINVLEGKVTKLGSRFKMSASGEISYRRVAKGTVVEIASQQVGNIKGGVAPAGQPGKLTKDPEHFRGKAIPGEFRSLARTENGFGNVLVLREPGFWIEFIGTNVVSDNVFFGVEGSFSEAVQTSLAEAPTPFPP